jgi:hypothetical protein
VARLCIEGLYSFVATIMATSCGSHVRGSIEPSYEEIRFMGEVRLAFSSCLNLWRPAVTDTSHKELNALVIKLVQPAVFS